MSGASLAAAQERLLAGPSEPPSALEAVCKDCGGQGVERGGMNDCRQIHD